MRREEGSLQRLSGKGSVRQTTMDGLGTSVHVEPEEIENMGQRLYVGNLPFNATADDVRSAFEGVGEVSDVHLVMDRETGRARGFAFVTMGTDEAAQTAIQQLNGALLGGRPLR